MQVCFHVTNIAKGTKNIELRLLSEEAPTAHAAPVPPTLEEYYLYILGEQKPHVSNHCGTLYT